VSAGSRLRICSVCVRASSTRVRERAVRAGCVPGGCTLSACCSIAGRVSQSSLLLRPGLPRPASKGGLDRARGGWIEQGGTGSSKGGLEPLGCIEQSRVAVSPGECRNPRASFLAASSTRLAGADMLQRSKLCCTRARQGAWRRAVPRRERPARPPSIPSLAGAVPRRVRASRNGGPQEAEGGSWLKVAASSAPFNLCLREDHWSPLM
jgi:hypothetical protein